MRTLILVLAVGVLAVAQAQAATKDFSISIAPATQQLAAGGSAKWTISTAVVSSGAQTIALSAGALPSGVTAVFAPTSVSAGKSATLTLTAGACPAAGAAPLTINGSNGTITHTVSAQVLVTVPPPSATITAPANASLSGAAGISAASSGCQISRVEVWIDGALSGSSGASPLSLSWDTTAAADGAHTLQARA